MKLATFRRDGAERLGLVHSRDARLFDLAAKRALDSMLALTDAADAGLDAARELFERRGGQVDLSIDTGAAQLLAPLPGPGARPLSRTWRRHRTGCLEYRRPAQQGRAAELNRRDKFGRKGWRVS